MGRINERYRYEISPLAKPEAIVQGDKYRFTILTPSLIRMEYSEEGVFEDRATKVAINRNFEVPKFTVKMTGDMMKIYTDHLELTYHTQHPFSPSSLTARFYGEWGDNTTTWRFENTTIPYGGVVQNYWGTINQLDDFRGPVPLEKGLMSSHYTDWDDSKSMIICEDGWVEERPEGVIDTYLFAYRAHHVECLRDFLTLSGKLPFLPRYALGNWWSRYYRYTDTEFKALMEKFEEKGIPFSVACLDMDWHITKIDKKYGTGWSGYTWDKECFPNPKEFLSWLHDHGLRSMLNIHDREGIAPHEDGYLEMAKRLGTIDYENGQKINFDFGNPDYVNAYFECMRHQSEDDGVDFWWTDGFPENASAMVKADIPWMVNHFNYVDNARRGQRPMLLSRRCGMGGHRYGVGFSGDTWATWEMLDFLPDFTSKASNVGFGWWSHDVGGFMNGIRDDEMMVRWEQFSVFSPINRIHCTNNPFMSKEPWNYSEPAEKALVRFMRLRHELIPYIYTMNYRCWADNITLIRPIRYYNNNGGRKNNYYFGDELIVAPITEKGDGATMMGNSEVWLPEGLWFDFFSGKRYVGNRTYRVYRDLDNIPVFAAAGAIVPTTPFNGTNDISNPKTLKVDIFPGADHSFTLYEDDGISMNYENGDCVTTELVWKYGEKPVFTVNKPQGNLSLIPEKRDYILRFRKINNAAVKVTLDGKAVDFTADYADDTLTITVKEVMGEVKVEFTEAVEILANDFLAEADALLMKLQMSNADKWHISKLMRGENGRSVALLEIAQEKYDIHIRNALTELLLADTI